MSILSRANENYPSAFIVTDCTGRVVDANKGANDLFGYDAAELVGKEVEQLINFSIEDTHHKQLKKYFQNPENQRMAEDLNLKAIRKDNSEVTVQIGLSSYSNNGRQYAIANILDITHKAQITEMLNTTQLASKIGSWQLDIASNKCTWSKMVYEIHEVDEATEIYVEDGINFYAPEYRERIQAHVLRGIEHGQSWDAELKILTASGKEKWVQAIGTPVIERGKVTALVGSFQDIDARKRLELERESLLAKLMKTEELTESGHWELTLDPEKVQWSSGLFKIWGLPFAEQAPSIEEQTKKIHPEDREHFLATLAEATETLKPFSTAFRILKDGEVRHIQGEGTPERGRDGKLLGFFGTAQDVTLSKREERTKEAIARRLALALQASKVGVWEWNLASNELIWDDHMYLLYGIKSEDFNGAYSAWENGLHPEDKEQSTELIKLAIRGEAKFDIVFRIVWPSGETRFIKALSEVVMDDYGSVAAMIGVNWDVTDEIQHQKTIEASNERYELMTQGSSVGVWDWPNIYKQKQYWSPKLFELLGYEDKSIDPTKDNYVALQHPDDREYAATAKQEHIDNGVLFDINYRMKTKSEGYRWFRVAGQASRTGNRDAPRMVSTVQDIHEQILAEEELKKSNEELLQISYRTSHDLRAPLISSRRLAEFIVEDIDNGELDEARKNSQRIGLQMSRLETLVADLLALAKADVNTEAVSPINLAEIIREIRDRPGWLESDKNVEVLEDIQVDTAFSGERVRLEQIIENLLTNGVKYKNPERDLQFVKISAWNKDKTLHINIADNGLGIPEQYLSDVFKMFKRFHPKVSAGSGLGLSIVKKHIDYLNGTIEVSSSESGTEFEIAIPMEKIIKNETSIRTNH